MACRDKVCVCMCVCMCVRAHARARSLAMLILYVHSWNSVKNENPISNKFSLFRTRRFVKRIAYDIRESDLDTYRLRPPNVVSNTVHTTFFSITLRQIPPESTKLVLNTLRTTFYNVPSISIPSGTLDCRFGYLRETNIICKIVIC